MIFPLRCFQCGSNLLGFKERYFKYKKKGYKDSEFFKKFNITDICCKNIFKSSK